MERDSVITYVHMKPDTPLYLYVSVNILMTTAIPLVTYEKINDSVVWKKHSGEQYWWKTQ